MFHPFGTKKPFSSNLRTLEAFKWYDQKVSATLEEDNS